MMWSIGFGLLVGCSSFVPTSTGPRPTLARAAIAGLDRREMLGALALVAPVAVGLPAPASAQSIKSIDKTLTSLGLPALGSIPGGFSAALATYTQNRAKPLLVTFAFPNGWLIVKPSINTNGESGTISAGDYGKGDSASLYVSDQTGDLTDKSFLTKFLIAGISQRGDNQYQSFKLGAIKKGTADGYVSADFSYELLTGAGFVVERKGVASITKDGTGAQGLLAVTTASRWKKLEDALRTTTSSFRCYETTAQGAAIAGEED